MTGHLLLMKQENLAIKNRNIFLSEGERILDGYTQLVTAYITSEKKLNKKRKDFVKGHFEENLYLESQTDL